MKTIFNWQQVVRFNFTYALECGAWLEDSNENRNWFSWASIAEHFSNAWVERQLRVQGWMTGCWVSVQH